MRLQVFPGFLPSTAAAVDPFTVLNLPSQDYNLSSELCDERFIGKAHLPPTFASTIMETLGILPTPDPHGSIVTTMQMFASTPRHKDNVSGGGVAAFIFMNSNPNAYFDYGGTSIPIIKGNLVSFDGNVPHNTVIKKGSVEILGPWFGTWFSEVGAGAKKIQRLLAPW